MDTTALTLVCNGYLPVEQEACDREFDREGHEHWGRVIDEKRSGKSDAEVRMPIYVEV
jgi:hypothetical protein